jgi:hypothetical protein
MMQTAATDKASLPMLEDYEAIARRARDFYRDPVNELEWKAAQARDRERNIDRETGIFTRTASEFVTGIGDAALIAQTASVLAGGDPSGVALRFKERNARKVSPGMMALGEADTWGETFQAIGENPSVLVEQTARSLASAIPTSIAGGALGAAGGAAAGSAIPVVGTAAGGVIGGAVGAGSGSAALSGTLKFWERLGALGVDTTDAKAIEQARGGPEWRQALSEAQRYGLTVGAIDAASAGAAGKIAGAARGLVPVAEGASAARRLASSAVAQGVNATAQGAMGAAGEVAGSTAAGLPVNPSDVIMEFAGELAAAPMELASLQNAAALGRRMTGEKSRPAMKVPEATPATEAEAQVNDKAQADIDAITRANVNAGMTEEAAKERATGIVGQEVQQAQAQQAAEAEAIQQQAREALSEAQAAGTEAGSQGLAADDLTGIDPTLARAYMGAYRRARRAWERSGGQQSPPTVEAQPEAPPAAEAQPEPASITTDSQAPEAMPTVGVAPGAITPNPEVPNGQEQGRQEERRRQEVLTPEAEAVGVGSTPTVPAGPVLTYPDTPQPIADAMAGMLDAPEGASVLDPSAGRGALLAAVARARPQTQRRGVEIDPSAAAQVDPAVGAVQVGDSLTGAVEPADRVVVAPPFENVMPHLRKAWDATNPGGRMVALVPRNELRRIGSELPIARRKLVSAREMGLGQDAGAIIVMNKPVQSATPEPRSQPKTEDSGVSRRNGATVEAAPATPNVAAATPRVAEPETKLPHHVAVYNGKAVSMGYAGGNQFRVAGMRIADNNASGYVVTPNRKVYAIGKGKKTASVVRDGPTIARVLREAEAAFEQAPTTPRAPDGYTVQDVTPQGYGPAEPTPESDAESAEVEKDAQRRAHDTRIHKLRSSINEGLTLLRGKMSGERRAVIERQVAKQRAELFALSPENNPAFRDAGRPADVSIPKDTGYASASEMMADRAKALQARLEAQFGKYAKMTVAWNATHGIIVQTRAEFDAPAGWRRVFVGGGLSKWATPATDEINEEVKGAQATTQPQPQKPEAAPKARVVSVKLTALVNGNVKARLEMAETLRTLVGNGTLRPATAEVLAEVLAQIPAAKIRRLKMVSGDVAKERAGMTYQREKFIEITLKRGLGDMSNAADPDVTDAAVALEELGHALWIDLPQEDRSAVQQVYDDLGEEGRAKFFEGGIPDTTPGVKYAASNVEEFFAHAFAEWVISRRLPSERVLGVFKRLGKRLLDAVRRVLARDNDPAQKAALDRLEPALAAAMGEKPRAKDRETGRLFARGTLPATIDVDGQQRPTTNSNGQPIHPTQEGVRAFWRWFGESKVVDAQGRPKLVYHGTHSDFSVFNRLEKAQSRKPGSPDLLGSWFTTDETASRAYGPKVVAAYIRATNPVEFTGVAGDAQRATKILFDKVKTAGGSEAYRDRVMSRGHDGIAIIGDKLDGLPGDVYVTFSPEQIKSATGNRGTFDADSPNILFSRAPSTPAQTAAAAAIRDGKTSHAAVATRVKRAIKAQDPDGKVSRKAFVEARREALRIVREAGKDGANLETALAASQERARVKATPKGGESVKATVQRTTGVAPTDPEAQRNLTANLRAQQRAASEAFRAGQQDERQRAEAPPRETLAQRLARVTGTKDTSPAVAMTQAAAMRVALRREARAANLAAREARKLALDEMSRRLDEMRGKEKDRAKARRRAITIVKLLSPPANVKRYLSAIANARGEKSADALITRVLSDLAAFRYREAKAEALSALKKAKPKKMREELRGDVEQARKTLAKIEAERAAALEQVARIRERAAKTDARARYVEKVNARLTDKLNRLRGQVVTEVVAKVEGARAAQRHWDEVLVGERRMTRETVAADFMARVEKLPDLKDDTDVPHEGKAGLFARVWQRMYSRDTLAALLGDGLLGRMLVADVRAGESRYMRRYERGIDARRVAMEAEGVAWGSIEARNMSAQADPKRAKLIELKVGGKDLKLTEAEWGELYAVATDNDARGKMLDKAPIIIERLGASMTQPVKLTRADLDMIQRTPKLARIRNIVDRLKLDYNRNVTPDERAAFREHFGYDMPHWGGYWPTRRQNDVAAANDAQQVKTTGLIGDYSGSGPKSLATTAMWKERVDTAGPSPYVIGDFFTTHDRAIRESAARIELNRTVRGLNAVIRDPGVRNTLIRKFGRQTYQQLALSVEHSAIILRPEGRAQGIIRPLQVLQRNVSRAFLSVSPSAVLKNVGGVAKLVAVMDPKYLTPALKSIGDSAAFGKVYNRMVAGSPFLRDRHDQGAAVRAAAVLGETSDVVGPLGVKDAAKRGQVGELTDRLPFFAWGDSRASVIAWRAAELQVAAEQPALQGAARTARIAEIAEAAIRATQNAHTVIDTDYLRSKYRGTIAAPLFMFTSDGITSLNLMESARIRHGVRSREFARAAAGVMANNAWAAGVTVGLTTVLPFLVAAAAGRADEEEYRKNRKTFAEVFSRELLANTMGLVYGGGLAMEFGESVFDALAGRQMRSGDMALSPLSRVTADLIDSTTRSIGAVAALYSAETDDAAAKARERLTKGVRRMIETGTPLMGLPIVPPLAIARRSIAAATGDIDPAKVHDDVARMIQKPEPDNDRAAKALALTFRGLAPEDLADARDKAVNALLRRGPDGTLSAEARTAVWRTLPPAERDARAEAWRQHRQRSSAIVRKALELARQP